MLRAPCSSPVYGQKYFEKSWFKQTETLNPDHQESLKFPILLDHGSVLSSGKNPESISGSLQSRKVRGLMTSPVYCAGEMQGITTNFKEVTLGRLDVCDVDCSLSLGSAKIECDNLSTTHAVSSLSSDPILKPLNRHMQLQLCSSLSHTDEKLFENIHADPLSRQKSRSQFDDAGLNEKIRHGADCLILSDRGAECYEPSSTGRSALASWSRADDITTNVNFQNVPRVCHVDDLQPDQIDNDGPSLELELSTTSNRAQRSDQRLEPRGGNQWPGNHGMTNSISPEEGARSLSLTCKAGTSRRGGDIGHLPRICADCGTMKTPLWRNGPQGPKSLCNACGIRFKKSEKRPDSQCSDVTTPIQIKQFLKREFSLAHADACKKGRWTDQLSAPEINGECNGRVEAGNAGGSYMTRHGSSSPARTTCSTVESVPSKKKYLLDDSRAGGTYVIGTSTIQQVEQRSRGTKYDSDGQILARDEEEGAVLLMVLSCGTPEGN